MDDLQYGNQSCLKVWNVPNFGSQLFFSVIDPRLDSINVLVNLFLVVSWNGTTTTQPQCYCYYYYQHSSGHFEAECSATVPIVNKNLGMCGNRISVRFLKTRTEPKPKGQTRNFGFRGLSQNRNNQYLSHSHKALTFL